jgi:hypothetical protein
MKTLRSLQLTPTKNLKNEKLISGNLLALSFIYNQQIEVVIFKLRLLVVYCRYVLKYLDMMIPYQLMLSFVTKFFF